MNNPNFLESHVGQIPAIQFLQQLGFSYLSPEEVAMTRPTCSLEEPLKREEFYTRVSKLNRDRMPLRYESGATHRYLGRQYRLKIQAGQPRSVRLVGGYFHITTPKGSPVEAETALNVWLRDKAKEQFTARLAKCEPWCAVRKLPPPRLRLLSMPKRWGSSHRDGRIYLNPELVKAPALCIDYVIAHEVCHLKHPQHDRSFFKLLEQTVPNWRVVKARLEKIETSAQPRILPNFPL